VGWQVQALAYEALADLLEKRKQGRPRRHVMVTYLESHAKYRDLYQKEVKGRV